MTFCTMRRLLVVWIIFCQASACRPKKPGASTATGTHECDDTCLAQAQPPMCIGTDDYFANYSWPEVFSICVQCHTAGGQADGTRFILKPDTIPNYIALDMAVVTDVMQIEQDGTPLMILKSTNSVDHGGNQQLSAGSKGLAILEETIARLKMPVVCPGDMAPLPLTQGVTLLDAYGTLKKATWQLVGRPPSAAEIAAVDAGGLDALDAVLGAQMNEPAFYDRLRDVYSDIFLTDGFRANNVSTNTGNIVNSDYYPPGAVDYWGGADWDWRSWPDGEGIRLVEALAREPVELVVRAVKNDLPMSEILTAKLRLLNAYSARFFKVPYQGAMVTSFAGIANPQAYVEVASVPVINEAMGTSEYAGILTTTAFLNRYPSSPTNFNRKRSRFTYKYFLNFDIMKTAPRIDASAVDLNAYPTRNNPQCTGCHSQIDPVAGAYMNEDECGYDYATYYQPPGAPSKSAECSDNGWVVSDHMFPPGVGAGTGNQLTLADRPTALEKLAAYVVGQPGFAEAMVSHAYVGLMNRGLLVAPADSKMPGYAALDAAFNAEKDALAALTKTFKDAGLKLKPVIIALVKSPSFRAADSDNAARLELLALGGGSLTTPEVLNRKVIAATGYGWRTHLWENVRTTGYQDLGPHDGSEQARLVLREEVKTLYGGLDGSFDGVKARQRLPSTLTAAIVDHMALEVSCISTTRDFDKPTASRLLFPKVEKSAIVSGDPTAADQAAIVQNIQYLHERFLGERLSADDPEIVATYQLLKGAKDDHAGAPAALDRPCSDDIDLGTGAAVAGGTTTDPTYMVRAWQAVIAYLLMDYRFVFEP
jgi:hypothetical protein